MSAAGRQRLPDASLAAADPPPGPLCDHCGGAVGKLNPWDWPGRSDGIWLHTRCEEGWFDTENAATADNGASRRD
jgi:hypothetical protein